MQITEYPKPSDALKKALAPTTSPVAKSVCADAPVETYRSGTANYSLGCDGSRKFSGIEDGEMVMGFPAELLPQMVRAVEIVTAAPGSKK